MMDQTISDTNQVLRLQAYRRNYSTWKYEPKIREVERAIVLPQTTQTIDHDLKQVFHHPLMAFNGGVYTDTGQIVEEAIHEGMLGVRHVPDTKNLISPERQLKGTWLYGGFLFRHIGHMMTESVGRLWAMQELPAGTKLAGVIFIAMNGFVTPNSSMSEWVEQSAAVTERSMLTQQMLQLFGIDVPVRYVGPAVQIERLIVPTQLMGLLPYKDLMNGHEKYRRYVQTRVSEFTKDNSVIDKKRIYVSRARFHKPTSASIFGETALDEYFAAHDYKVIYPETMSLRSQIEHYNSASHIVMAAGSAAHVAALAMNGTQEIALLKRFPGQQDQFGPQLLAMGASRVTTIDVIAGRFLPLDEKERNEFSEPVPAGIYSIDFLNLWSQLGELGFVDQPLNETMRNEIDAQVPVISEKLAERYGKMFGLVALKPSLPPINAPAAENVDITAIVTRHPAVQVIEPNDLRHVSLPHSDGMVRIEVNLDGVKALSDLGIQVIGEFGDGNCVYLYPDMPRINLQVAFYRRHRNTLVMGMNTRLRGRLDMASDENIFVAGSASADVGISAMFRYHRGGLILGKGGSAPVTNYWIEGPDCSILIGDDFLFSWGIWLRTADSHGLVDLESGKLVNRPKSIVLENHVWLGQDVIVMPGNRIARGAVIGARSIVTKDIPSCCVAVGSPAKVVRHNTSWTRSANPDAAAINELIEQMKSLREDL